MTLAPSGTEAKGYYNAGYGRTYYYGPTRYYFFYGGQRHYYGTRNWGQCNGHCDQDVYIDEAEFIVYYDDAPSTSAALDGLQMSWPGLDRSLISVTTGIVPTARHFRLLLPDGSSPASFAQQVKSDVERACETGTFNPVLAAF